MGGEFAPGREWNHDRSLDWHQLDDRWHRGVQKLVRDCNAVYRALPALHELDNESTGFEWIVSDQLASVVAFARRARQGDADLAIAVVNFTPVPRRRLSDRRSGAGHLCGSLNTDDPGTAAAA